MKSLPYKLETTNDILTSRGGLTVLAQVMSQLNLSVLINQHFPPPGSNRGYWASDYVNTFIMMLNEGGQCLEDVRHLKRESDLLSVLGLDTLPSADAMGDWLRRHGKSKTGINALARINKPILSAALHDRKRVTLDIDATPILCSKRDAKYTYLKKSGYMPMVGHIEEVSQIVSMEFRRGNVPPAKDNLGFIKQCMAALPEGVRVSKLRIDAAGYQAAILDYAVEQHIDYAVRAKMSAELREMILSRADSDWQAVVTRNGKQCEQETSCRLTHMMQASEHPFTVVVQRRVKKGQQSLELGDDENGESAEHGGYLYRAIATNRDDMTNSELIHWYNQRAEHSENRIKELKNDFAASQLPCGDFKANELYFGLCGLAYNVFALMRQLLPEQWAQNRVSTIRWRLYALAGKLVRHGRQWTIKMSDANQALLSRVLQHLRRFVLAP
jgi:hypothetical protein